ncbi:MAG TPA: hypothetical protein VFV55_10115, partial [Usitatibacteraceae bacterium]|nr:hypothetical protein [Usitatibacteraceae bacterium]
MRTHCLFVALAACALATLPAVVKAAGTEMLDLDPIMAAKVAKEKAKAGAAGKGTGLSADKTTTAGKGECGVNIGNLDSGKQGPGKGFATPRDSTVVITGPVI